MDDEASGIANAGRNRGSQPLLKRRTALVASLALGALTTQAKSQTKDTMMQHYPPTELLAHATVRIECVNANNAGSSGTGFFYFLFNSGDHSVPVIVTNKHVLQGNIKAIFVLTLAKADGTPDNGNIERVEITDLPQNWIGHPDPEVDLAIIPMAGLYRKLTEKNKKPFLAPLEQSLIPTPDMLNSLTPVEDIIVVGYPDGIWDSHNNLPIFRRGVTATAPYINFNGESRFLIDCSIFLGSSGSPVILYNSGSYPDRRGNLTVGQRLYFLGFVYAVATHAVAGQIIFVPAPTDSRPVPMSAIPNNLGICVMASRVLDFEPILAGSGLLTPPPNYQMRSVWRNKS